MYEDNEHDQERLFDKIKQTRETVRVLQTEQIEGVPSPVNQLFHDNNRIVVDCLDCPLRWDGTLMDVMSGITKHLRAYPHAILGGPMIFMTPPNPVISDAKVKYYSEPEGYEPKPGSDYGSLSMYVR